jgi:glucose-6-phosphate isomerase/transaldolase/glucose-6-phosphate isomerase
MSLSAPSSLGPLQKDVQAALVRLEKDRIARRIRDRDHAVWRPDPAEISNRLGWLDSPTSMAAHLGEIRQVIDAARNEGCTHALLLGMGGSSLAPEVFRLTFGATPGFLDLGVLDSTHPAALLEWTRRLDPAKTLYLPATKSGGTVETMSFFKYFYNQTARLLGPGPAGRHFVAITDPGSGLEDLARQLKCRHVFLNDPEIGGRYSALSFFGLVPGGAIGMDLEKLLARARQAADDPQAGLVLGAALGAGAMAGRDKLTLIASPGLEAAGAWVEQLIAESTGKEGKGILPVDREPLLAPSAYGKDRLFAYVRLQGDDQHDRPVQALVEAGQPVVQMDLDEPYDLGAAFFEWEMATAIAGHLIDIHPFDQPNVEAAKVLARRMVQAYQEEGRLPELEPTLREGGLTVYGDAPAASLGEALQKFLSRGQRNRSYIALQAYLHSAPQIDAALQKLRRRLLERTGLATTLGFGPRFLHSTGQLHKGDGGNGLFIQFIADPQEDAPIPDAAGKDESGISFGVLIAAQALGDRQALLDAGRPVLRLHLGKDTEAGLAQVGRAL